MGNGATYTVSSKAGYADHMLGLEAITAPLNLKFEMSIEPSRTWYLRKCQEITINAREADEKVSKHSVKLLPSNTVDNENALYELAVDTAWSVVSYAWKDDMKKILPDSDTSGSSIHHNEPERLMGYGRNLYDDIYKETCKELEKVTGITPKKRSPKLTDESNYSLGFRRRVPLRRFPSRSQS